MSEIEQNKIHVLIADDQQGVLDALHLLLKGEGIECLSAKSPSEVIRHLKNSAFDCVLMDLNYARDTTSGQEGLDLLAWIRSYDETLPVVVMTAWASIDLAIDSIRHGAQDFIQKPWDNNRLISILRTQSELSRLLRRSQRLEAENEVLSSLSVKSPLIAKSHTMRTVLDLIKRIGPSDANVLISGENGTGKGLVAEHLHALSRYANKPMVTVDMGGLSETLFESELFGHVKGAFTGAHADRLGRFEMADGGCIFLDEIANIPMNLQSKLLRFVETGEFERLGSSRTIHVNIRIISATNIQLDKEIIAGRFRQDLFFRLNTIEIHLPPLRERKEDIPFLVNYFLEKHAGHYRKSFTGIEPEALSALLDYRWPGNIRELDHTIERAVLLATNSIITRKNLNLPEQDNSQQRIDELPLEEAERVLIQKAIDRAEGNIHRAAKSLGISRSSLYRRLEKYHLKK